MLVHNMFERIDFQHSDTVNEITNDNKCMLPNLSAFT